MFQYELIIYVHINKGPGPKGPGPGTKKAPPAVRPSVGPVLLSELSSTQIM